MRHSSNQIKRNAVRVYRPFCGHHIWSQFRIGWVLILSVLALTLFSLTAAGSNAAVFSFMDPVREFLGIDMPSVQTPVAATFEKDRQIPGFLAKDSRSFSPFEPLAATVTTNAATAKRRTSAMLKGTVNANGENTVVTFEYGLTTAYGNTVTAAQSPLTVSGDTSVNFALIGVLTPGTTYHFRVVGVNGSGTTYGSDATFATNAAGSSTYYVDKTNVSCSDSGTGTLAVPFCTIGRAIGATVPYADAGDTVRVLAGTYAETVKWDNTNGGVGIPLTLSAAPGVTVTGLAAGNGFQVTSHSYIVIDGFSVTDSAGYGIYVIGSNNITISNNHVSSAGSPTAGNTRVGIYIDSTTDSLITGNTTDHNSSDGIRLTSGSTNNTVSNNISFANASEFQRDACGINLVVGSNYNTISHNITYANEDTGLNLYTGSSYNLVIGNLTYVNGDHGIDNNAAPNNVIVGNTVQGNVTVGINIEGATSPGSGGATVINNVLMDNGLLRQTDGSTSTGYAGNIEVDPRSLVGTTLDYNLYYLTPAEGGTVQVIWNGTSYTSLAAFHAAVPGQETNAVVGNPLFGLTAQIAERPYQAPFSVAIPDPVGDYHLTAGSPAIDSANADAPNAPILDIEGNARVDDPAIADTGAGTRTYDDRGAYEYQPPPTPTVTTAASSGVTDTSALLNGSANPNSAATTGWFRYATADPIICSDTFGTRAPASGGSSLGSGSSSVPYSQAISGLSPGTPYFFCAIASNSIGTSVGSVQSFTTASPAKYRSRTSGNWNDFNTWQVDTGGGFVDAVSGQTPISADDTIEIRSAHVVTVTANVSADQLTVDVGGELGVTSGIVLTVDNGATGFTVNGTLTTGTVLSPGLINGAGTFVLNSGANLWTADANGITTSACGAGPTCGSVRTASRSFDGGASYIYNGTTNQAVGNGLPASVTNLTIATTGASGSNTVTGNPGQTVTGSLLVQSGIFSSAGAYNNVQIDTGATYSAASDITVSGNWANAGTYLHNGFGVTFNGSGNTQTISGTNSFSDLTIDHTGAGGVTAASSTLSVAGLLHVRSGTFTSATAYNNVQIDAAGTLSLSGPITVSGNWTNNGAFTHNSKLVTFNGSAAQSIGGTSTTSFSGLTDSNTSAAVTFNTNFNVAGTFTMNGTGTLFTPGSPAVQINSAGNTGTITGTGRVQVTSLSANPFSNQYRFFTFSVTALTVEWAGAGDQNIENGVSGYGGIRTSGTGTKTIGGSGTLLITGDVTIGVSTTLNQGANTLNIGGNWSNGGGFTAGTPPVGITLSGSGSQTVTTGGSGAGKSFGLLSVNKPGGTATLAGPLRVSTLNFVAGTFDTSPAGNFAVTTSGPVNISGGTFIANASVISVGGNWTNNSTFTAGTSTVNFNGGTGQTLTGSTSFYNFAKSITTPAQQMNFAENVTTVTNSLTFTGAPGNLLSLRSTTPGNQWQIVAPATQSVSYVDVQDSFASTTTVTATNSVDSGNNVNWSFPAVAPSALTYSTNPATYTVGTTITNNMPTNSGGEVTSYSISAAFASTGLSFDTSTGVIGGTPLAVSAATGYTVTATNSGGSTTATVTITVQPVFGVASTSPIDGVTGAARNTSISVTFNRAATVSSITVNADAACSGTLQVSNDGFATCVAMAASPVASGANTTFAVSPAAPLTGSTIYRIRVTTGAQDAAGVPLVATFNQATGFTTKSALTVVSTAPVDGAAVGVNATVRATFNTAADPATLTTTANPACTGSFQLSVDNFITCVAMSGSPVSSGGNTVFTATPAAPLSDGTYRIRITTAATDQDGIALGSTYSGTGFTVDSISPVITYTSIANRLSTSNVPLSLTVTDNFAVGSVAVYYMVNGVLPYTEITCPAGVPVNSYDCLIPGQPGGSAVTYYMTATDSANNTTEDPLSAAPSLYTVGAGTIPAGTYETMSLSDGSLLDGNVIVSDTFDLGGVVTTGPNTLELGCTASVTGAGAASYVNGNIRKDFCGTGAFSFPVGENGYTPVTTDITALGIDPSSLTVRSFDVALIGFDPAQSLSRKWQIDETGDVTATLSFTYLPADVNGIESSYRVWRVVSSGAVTNMCPGGPCVSSPVLGPVAGVTQFSLWTGSGPLAATAAETSLSGRVRTAGGSGIRNAMVTVAGGNLAQPITVITSTFGYYHVKGLTAGQGYVVSVMAKRYTFTESVRAVQLFEDTTGFDFVADR